jgi:glucose-6-phosphate 1-dehydrogenase
VRTWEATPGPLPQYEAGTQGPEEANRLLEAGDRWRAI